ncbi:MAG: flagellar hook-basal body complex protein FliE [Candidatus Bathyarchaeota archaeon]|nr:MAG: flagellar hook-basal body complex protein FliE [Candidatus Bathyarchaeota archaeon]
MKLEKKVIGIVGMPGSGKSVFDNIAKQFCFSIVIMGDVVREETQKRGLELTPENIGKVMMKMREEKGSDIVAKTCVPKVKESKSKKVVIDGIRNLVEVEEFKNKFPEFTLVHIHSSPKTRFERLFYRKRSDDPKSWKKFSERDCRELRVGIGSVIALADYVLINEGTLSQFEIEAKDFLKTML